MAQTKASPVTTLKPIGAVWQAALSLVNGDYSRLQVVSPTEVIAHNSSEWKTRPAKKATGRRTRGKAR